MEKNINDIIRNRRSIYPKEFSGEVLEDGIIETLIENANMAPNHLSNYPWRFLVIKGNAMKDWISKAADIYVKDTPPEKFKQEKLEKIQKNSQQISHAIAIIMQFDKEGKSKEREDICAIACGVQNMYLSMDQFVNAGGYWSTGLGTYSNEMSDYLGLSKDQELLGYFILGYVVEKRTLTKRRNYKEFVRYL